MKDRLGRTIEYARISVTQNCNLKCIYCIPGTEESSLPACTPISAVEFGIIAASLVELGIRKIRVTGGEPLMRRDIIEIIEHISRVPGIEDLSLTTNGIRLKQCAHSLKEAGLIRVNISLDSLQEETFKRMTGGGRLADVLAGIKEALSVGLVPVKINTVLVRGVNDGEVDDFIQLAKDRNVVVRFIELMPIGRYGEENVDKMIPSQELIQERPYLIEDQEMHDHQPARYYRVEGTEGRIGFISPMSHRFCDRCNRIRITCDGKVKPCLGNNGEVDILDTLRMAPEQLTALLRDIIFSKPEGHGFGLSFSSQRNMNRIGG